jgi:hypothetical protein
MNFRLKRVNTGAFGGRGYHNDLYLQKFWRAFS